MSETIEIISQGDTYSDALANAMEDIKQVIGEEAKVHRAEGPDMIEMRDWYVVHVAGELAAGRKSVACTVIFELYGSAI